MDKREFFCLLLAVFSIIGTHANAQSSAGAYQRIELHILPSIEISTLQPSELQLSVKKDKAGSTAQSHEFRIRSNKNFVVKASTYNPATDMQEDKPAMSNLTAKNNLHLSVEAGNENNELVKYTSISNSPKDIITKGRRGEQTFAVNYRVKRAGKQYNTFDEIGVVYTATEP